MRLGDRLRSEVEASKMAESAIIDKHLDSAKAAITEAALKAARSGERDIWFDIESYHHYGRFGLKRLNQESRDEFIKKLKVWACAENMSISQPFPDINIFGWETEKIRISWW